MEKNAESKLYEKLNKIQTELNCPKNQYNNFGNYKYRNCEDILESLKPLLKKHKCLVTLNDDLMLIGERYYIKATATISDVESEDKIEQSAFAREPLGKKGMDEAQITGSTSSYARKYALNGLFLIDDNKDADELQKDNTPKKDNYSNQYSNNTKIEADVITEKQLKYLYSLIKEKTGSKEETEKLTEEVKTAVKNLYNKDIKNLTKREFNIILGTVKNK